jgi:hypothetical protein
MARSSLLISGLAASLRKDGFLHALAPLHRCDSVFQVCSVWPTRQYNRQTIENFTPTAKYFTPKYILCFVFRNLSIDISGPFTHGVMRRTIVRQQI